MNRKLRWILTLTACGCLVWGQSTTARQAAVELFEQARDAIDAQNWLGAEARLRGYLRSYPRESRADAALYYLGFVLKKQERLREAAETLQQLIAAHPDSPWKADAEAMNVELAGRMGKATVTGRALRSDDDRVRAAALRNLFRDDPEKGKAECARLLASGNPRVARFCLHLLLESRDRDSVSRVIAAARSDAVPEVRIAAMILLAGAPDKDAVNAVREILKQDRSRVAEAALYALYRRQDWVNAAFLTDVLEHAKGDWVRGGAMLLLGMEGSASGLQSILRAFDTAGPGLLQKFALDAMWRNGSEQAKARLGQLAASARDVTVQHAARFYLAGPRGTAAAEALARWYDAEPVEEIRMNLLALLSLTQTEAAIQKLREVRTLDASQRLRRQAEALLEHGDIKIPLPLGQKQLPVAPPL